MSEERKAEPREFPKDQQIRAMSVLKPVPEHWPQRWKITGEHGRCRMGLSLLLAGSWAEQSFVVAQWEAFIAVVNRRVAADEAERFVGVG